jgi:hypothetical protein
VFGETLGLGQDKTDITIVSVEGSYVIEVKWMGKNKSNTEHNEERIDEGLVQIALYLENDKQLICGYLVIYDARSLDVHKTRCGYNESLRHGFCQTPRIIFLESETPSQAGERIVAELSDDSGNS